MLLGAQLTFTSRPAEGSQSNGRNGHGLAQIACPNEQGWRWGLTMRPLMHQSPARPISQGPFSSRRGGVGHSLPLEAPLGRERLAKGRGRAQLN